MRSSSAPATAGQPSSLAIWSALIAVYLAWGSTYLAIRFVVETMPPFFSAGLRFLISGAVLYALRRLRGDPAPRKIEWRSAAIIGFFLLVGGNGNVVWAEQRVPSSIAALIIASVPLWMAVLDAIRPGGRRPQSLVTLGLLVGFVGIFILIGPGQLIGSESQVDLLGAGALLLASLSWAIGSLYNRGARLPASPLLGTGMEMLLGSVGLFLLATLSSEWGQLDFSAVAARSWWGLIYLIIFGSWVGFASYVWLLRVAPTTLVSTYAYVNPLVAILVGNLLAGEEISPRVILAAITILGSVAVITYTQQRSARADAASAAVSPSGDD